MVEVRNFKLERKHYWFGFYISISESRHLDVLTRNLRQIRDAVNADHVYLYPGSLHYPELKSFEEWKKVLRACRKLGLSYFLPLSPSGNSCHSISVDLLRAIRKEKGLDAALLGLFTWEQPTPSLTTGRRDCRDTRDVGGSFIDAKHTYWFDTTHYRIPNFVGSTSPCPPDMILADWELDEKLGATVKPLPKPIENPVEALNAWRFAFWEWAKDYLEAMSPGMVLSPMNWTGLTFTSVAHGGYDACGFQTTKQAMALPADFGRWSMQVEVNGREYSVSYAQARSISRCGNAPWGIMATAWRWLHWQDILASTGARGNPRSSLRMECPGWIYFVPCAVAWSAGARIFHFECNDIITRVPKVRKAISSFQQFVNLAGEPMNPEVQGAVLKGNGYFAWDVPGYENGMNTEIISRRQDSIFSIFYPRLGPAQGWFQSMFSGNPYGELDVLPCNAENEVLKRYPLLILFDWNTMTEDFHGKLLDFVGSGGILIMHAGQLLCRTEGAVNWAEPWRRDFFREGNGSELCGIRIGPSGGDRVYPEGGNHVHLHVDRSALQVLAAQSPIRFKGESFGPLVETDLYQAELAGDNTRIIFKTDQGLPVCAFKSHGQGGVYTLLSWSYAGALGDQLGPFFRQVAGFIREKLSYTVKGLSNAARQDLIVFRDHDRLRLSMINYWDRMQMTPQIGLSAPPGRYTERLMAFDARGLVAYLRMPARPIATFGARITLPPRTVALLEYRRPGAKTFKFRCRCLKGQYRCGPVCLWPDGVVQIAGLPAGEWVFSRKTGGQLRPVGIRKVSAGKTLRFTLGKMKASELLDLSGALSSPA